MNPSHDSTGRKFPDPHTSTSDEPSRPRFFVLPKSPSESGPGKISARGRYREGAVIGSGGTAVIYQAFDWHRKQKVALKRFLQDLDGHEESLSAELLCASRLSHPNLMQIYEGGCDERGHFLAVELVEGKDLEERVSGQPLSLHSFHQVSTQLLAGLQAIHRQGLLHLDLKPSNVMARSRDYNQEEIKIIDFGRASLQTDAYGERPHGRGLDGSLHYVSPEQLLGSPLDVRTDLYAFGCVCYFLLSGQRPFQGANATQVMAAHLQNQVQPLHELCPDLPLELSLWVMNLISVRPEDRPQSCADTLNLLLAITPQTDAEQASRISGAA